MNKEQVEFLKELQEEMRTQDHVGQASPRFWAVGDYKWQPVADGHGEKTTIFCFDLNEDRSFTHEEMVEELVSYLEDWSEERPEAEGWIKELKLASEGDLHLELTVEEVLDGIGYDYSVQEEACNHFTRPDTFFLTLREAKEHIKRNAHHYSAKAHPYAMTAWRSPQVEKLYGILETVDWSQVESNLEKENA